MVSQAIGLTLLIFVSWPLLTLPAGIFSRDYFRFWIVLAMIWGTLAGAIAVAVYVWLVLLVQTE